ncbi:MAG: 6-phosphofructokinase [Deltaproteobacteria bacterium]|nr:6-phosphofructokinase [Deltaproteobacteria bacterium]
MAPPPDDDAPAPAPTRRACILTAGGDAPGLNAVLRAFVKRATSLGLEVFGSQDGFDGLVRPGRMVRLDNDSVRGILMRGGSILGCSNRANPFSYPVRTATGEELCDKSDEVVERIASFEIDVLVVVGGDGTMHMGKGLADKGIRVIGVPKTIDNDLAATDSTFGFDSAVHVATWAIDNLHATAEAHDRVQIVELMGRYAGWITLHAGIAGGADVILIPEIPYEIERVVQKIHDRGTHDESFTIIAVSEGAAPAGGGTAEIAAAKPGHLARLGGAGQRLADALKDKCDHEIRVTVLGHLQRGGSPSAFDRLLGSRFGARAAELCSEGASNRMVSLRNGSVTDVPLADVVGKMRRVDPSGELVRVARSLGVEMGTGST